MLASSKQHPPAGQPLSRTRWNTEGHYKGDPADIPVLARRDERPSASLPLPDRCVLIVENQLTNHEWQSICYSTELLQSNRPFEAEGEQWQRRIEEGKRRLLPDTEVAVPLLHRIRPRCTYRDVRGGCRCEPLLLQPKDNLFQVSSFRVLRHKGFPFEGVGRFI